MNKPSKIVVAIFFIALVIEIAGALFGASNPYANVLDQKGYVTVGGANTMTTTNGTTITIASTASGYSNEYGFVTQTNAQVINANATTNMNFLNGITGLNTTKLSYETNSSQFRVLQTGTYSIDLFIGLYKGSALGTSILYPLIMTNGLQAKALEWVCDAANSATSGCVQMPIVSLSSNTTVGGAVYHTISGTVTAEITAGNQPNLTIRYIGP